MKPIKPRALTHLIYGLLMLAPICAIGVKCGYVMFNKNAKDSYSNITKQSLGLVSDNSNNVPNLTYMIAIKEGTEYSGAIAIKSSTINYDYIAGTEISYNVSKIQFYPNNTHFRLIDDGNTFHNYQLNDEKRAYLNGQTFVYLNGNLYTNNQPVSFYSITYTTEKLDNVFYYAVDEFIEDNNFGIIDFKQWFNNMFLQSGNQVNDRLVNFANWYLNYTMLVSCIYLLWLVLMWFINFARKLLDRGMNYDW